jgi:hypothetical protein
MMAAVFAALLAALAFEFAGYGRAAVVCLLLSFGLGTWLFLWEVYSADYGFRMPWLEL